MLNGVRAWVDRHGMLGAGDRVVVSVSGGPDSSALLHVLHELAPVYGLSLHVFHMDHGLRGEASAADARHVRQQAEALGLPCTVVTLPAGELKQQSGSVQANARTARYAHLEALAEQIGANRIALGHNRDDQAETVCMRFLRGAGTRGLAGIPPVRQAGRVTYIRPLLDTPRTAIETYCRDRELSSRHDESNEKPDYLRNQIRLELLPHLAATYNPAIWENLAQLADVLRAEDLLLDQLAQQALQRCRAPGEGMALAGEALRAEPTALARRVVRLAARAVAGPVYELGLDAVTRVLDAAGNEEGSHRISLPGGLQAVVEYGVCRFQADQPADLRDQEWPLTVPGTTTIAELGIQCEVQPAGTPEGPMEALFDADLTPGTLAVRVRRPGDRLWPTGMEGSKKLQDLLVDAKVPRRLRDSTPLLVAGDEVLWVIGHRLDRRFLASPSSRHTWYVRVTPLSAKSH